MKSAILAGVRDLIRIYTLFKVEKIKFNVGSAGVNSDESWIATDIGTLDITKSSNWLRQLLWLKADNIMAEHVWEHLTETESSLAILNCYKYLKRGGVLRLAVPDGFFPDPAYIEYVRPGGSGAGADDHKVLYNYKSLSKHLESVGFKVELLEYWDEEGRFHYVDWNDDKGRIIRSRRYDSRNCGGSLRYTSLIVDAIKS